MRVCVCVGFVMCGCVCMCEFSNVWVYVWVGFVTCDVCVCGFFMCGCFADIYILVFTVLLYCFFYEYLFLFVLSVLV